MRGMLFLCSVLVLAGCQDRLAHESAAPPSPLAPSMSMDRHAPQSDFDFRGAEERWARLTPEERRGMRDASRREALARGESEQPPGAVAVVDRKLPGGAVVLVIRDPALPTPRLLVVSQETVDDVVLGLGSAVLGEDEERLPDPPGRRELHVTRDGRVVTVPGGEAYQLDMDGIDTGDRYWFTSRIERGAESVTLTDVPGIGRVKLIRF